MPWEDANAALFVWTLESVRGNVGAAALAEIRKVLALILDIN